VIPSLGKGGIGVARRSRRKTKVELAPDDTDLLNLFWVIPVFRALHSTYDLRALFESKEATANPAFLYGFKALLRVLFRRYLQDFENDSFLRLRSDKRTRRAIFAGIEHNKIPATCEKAIGIVNLGNLLDSICSGKSQDELIAKIEAGWNEFIVPLESIFKSSVSVVPTISSMATKDAMLQLVGSQIIWRCINRMPRFDSWSFLEGGREEEEGQEATIRKQWDHAFPGFKSGLAFIWKGQHEMNLGEAATEIQCATGWSELADRMIRLREAIAKTEMELGISFDRSRIFQITKPPQKAVFGKLIRAAPQREFPRNEKLDQTFMWLDIQVIDSAASRIFCGVPAFISLLMGELLQRRGFKNKLEVIRVVHRTSRYISYAMLMERGSAIYDASGWLIFHKVTWREEKTAGAEYYQVESLLKRLRRQVHVSEPEISDKDLDDFRMFKIKQELKSIAPSLTENEIMSLRIEQLERHRNLSKAVLLVFLTRTFFEIKGLKVQMSFEDEHVLTGEIDLLVTNESTKELAVVECSMHLSFDKIDDFVREMNRKLESVRSSGDYSSYSNYTKIFSTSAETLRKIRSIKDVLSRLEANSIKVITVEDDILPSLPRQMASRVSSEIWDRSFAPDAEELDESSESESYRMY
jgi:hypothetical protein